MLKKRKAFDRKEMTDDIKINWLLAMTEKEEKLFAKV